MSASPLLLVFSMLLQLEEEASAEGRRWGGLLQAGFESAPSQGSKVILYQPISASLTTVAKTWWFYFCFSTAARHVARRPDRGISSSLQSLQPESLLILLSALPNHTALMLLPLHLLIPSKVEQSDSILHSPHSDVLKVLQWRNKLAVWTALVPHFTFLSD